MTPEFIARVDAWLASNRDWVSASKDRQQLYCEWRLRSKSWRQLAEGGRAGSEAAMSGVLLAFVREAHAEPSIYACTMRRAEVVFGKVVDAGVEWIVTWGIVAVGCIARANTEAEALVLALEAAPR